MGRTGRLLGATAGAVLAGVLATALQARGKPGDATPEDARRAWMTRAVAPGAAAVLGFLRARSKAPIRGGVVLGVASYLGVFGLGERLFGLSEPEWDRPSAGVGQRLLACITTGVLVSVLANLGEGAAS